MSLLPRSTPDGAVTTYACEILWKKIIYKFKKRLISLRKYTKEQHFFCILCIIYLHVTLHKINFKLQLKFYVVPETNFISFVVNIMKIKFDSLVILYFEISF